MYGRVAEKLQLIHVVMRLPIEAQSQLNQAESLNLIIAFFHTARSFLSVRPKLADVNTIDQVVELLRTRRNIIVLTGAGVSVSCGIPDFRSRNGIYRRLRDEFGMAQPEDMFDIDYFRDNPQPFFSFAKELFPGNFKPSPSHFFIRLIEQKNKLLRNYTQNIDTLENVAGIHQVIQCHGSFHTASCQRCKHKVPGEYIRDDVFAQRIPYCSRCTKTVDDPDQSDEDDNGIQPILKPDIVFFGESLSNEFDLALLEDREKVDLLIVIGSSLKVEPVASIMNFIPSSIPQILINREPISHLEFDVMLLGNCDEIIGELCERLGWLEELETLLCHPFSRPVRHVAATSSTTNSESVEGADVTEHHQSNEQTVQLQGNQPFIFQPPNRYLFDGAVVGDSDDDDDEDDEGDGDGDGDDNDEKEEIYIDDGEIGENIEEPSGKQEEEQEQEEQEKTAADGD